MNTWIGIAWSDETRDNGSVAPVPIQKEVEVRPELLQSQVLLAFRRKFPHHRNHTVHQKTSDTEQVVLHGDPSGPIVIYRPISPAKKAMQAAPGTPSLRGQDSALQMEPPEKLTSAALAGTVGEVASQTPESGPGGHSLRESREKSPRSEPRRANPAPTSDKDCALTGADRSVTKVEPFPDCRVV